MKNQVQLITNTESFSGDFLNQLNIMSERLLPDSLNEVPLLPIFSTAEDFGSYFNHIDRIKQTGIDEKIELTYNFFLSPLILHAFFNADTAPLTKWLSKSPRNSVTVLDTHYGISILDISVDKTGSTRGLISSEEMGFLIETIHKRSGCQGKKSEGITFDNQDLYQVDCTYLEALGGNITDYVIARAIQFFSPGIPLLYYTVISEGRNNMELTGKIESTLKYPLTQKLFNLIRLRNNHPAFNGEFYIESPEDNLLEMRWENNGHWIMLHADLAYTVAVITGSDLDEEIRYIK